MDPSDQEKKTYWIENAISKAKNVVHVWIWAGTFQNRGYPPDLLVFGKGSKMNGSVISDEETATHHAALSPSAEGIRFREELACRENVPERHLCPSTMIRCFAEHSQVEAVPSVDSTIQVTG